MANLDDKLLGEKTHYYCSSSSSSEDEGGDEMGPEASSSSSSVPAPPPPVTEDWEGYSTNTGPKGVIQDFQRWKQLESEKRAENELERIALAKKLSFVCQTEAEAEKQKQDDEELDNLLDNGDDSILQEFMRKRMEEMMMRSKPNKTFGSLIRCSHGNQFLEEIESEPPEVKVICALYSLRQRNGNLLNNCFEQLAKIHQGVKFISVEVSSAGMSARFEEKGCPAILVYKQNSLIGNFVRVFDSLGTTFVPQDVEGFLVDHGFLMDSECVPELVASSKFRDSRIQEDDSSDEDI